MYLLESQLAKKHLQGKNLAFKDGYVQMDERLLQKELISRFPTPPEYAVLGSSTVMQFTKDLFPRKSFFNHAVRRGVLEDYIAIAQVYRDYGMFPEVMVVGIDSWIFDPLYWRTYWKSMAGEYQRFAHDFGICWKKNREEIHRAESFVQDLGEFAQSNGWKKVLSTGSMILGSESIVRETSEDFQDEYVKRSDGSVGYPASFRGQTPEDVLLKINRSESFPLFRIESGPLEAFEGFIKALVKEARIVIFYLPALHPQFFKLNGRNIKNYDSFVDNLDKVEAIVHERALHYDISVIGSYRVDLNLVTGLDFYDWIHMTPDGVKKVLKNGHKS
jgi:hypothetical protein